MYKYLLYFLIFSFLGWCAEVTFCFFKHGRFVNRGLARGPVCPIYGIGICLCKVLLGAVENFILLTLFAMAIATVVELGVGFFTHKMLGVRLWDYTGERGNIFGYVCPRFSLIWGVMCAVVIKLLPLLDSVVELMYDPFCSAVAVVLFVMVVVDSKNAMRDKTELSKRLNG